MTRAHAAIFQTMFKDSILKVETKTVRFLRTDIASIDARWSMIGARDAKDAEWPERHGLISAIAMETSGDWSFAVFHNQDLPTPERVADVTRQLS